MACAYRAFKRRRDKVVIGTKFGMVFKDGKQVGLETDSRPAQIRKAVEGSLRRLRMDYIDPTLPALVEAIGDRLGSSATLVLQYLPQMHLSQDDMVW